MGIFEKIYKYFEDARDERARRWREEQEQKRIQNAQRQPYYEAWIHNFILDSENVFEHLSDDNWKNEFMEDHKFSREHDEVYSKIGNTKVAVPAAPAGAFVMESVLEEASREDDSNMHEDYDYEFRYKGSYMEYDKGRRFYDTTHIFIDMILYRSKYREIRDLISYESYEALRIMHEVLKLQLWEEQKLYERD